MTIVHCRSETFTVSHSASTHGLDDHVDGTSAQVDANIQSLVWLQIMMIDDSLQ
jgi:hypothetical protein